MKILNDRGTVLAAAAGVVVAILIVASLVVLAPVPDVAVVSTIPPSARISPAAASLTPAAGSTVPVITPAPSPSLATVGIDVGNLAPDFEAPGLDGTTLRLGLPRSAGLAQPLGELVPGVSD